MGFFRRRSSDTPTPVPDPVFPALSTDDVAWIRRTAGAVLAARGVEATLESDGATFTAADGYRISLDNAVATCAALPREEWVGYLEQHFGAMAGATALPRIEDLTPEQLRAQIRTRILPTNALGSAEIDLSGYARPVADGLWAVLCVDFPETVSYVSPATAARLPDLDEAFRIGQTNTDAEPIDDVHHYDNGLIGVSGESVFIASKAMNPAALLAQTVGHDAPHGIVFAVPDRSSVLLHVIEDIGAVEAIGSLAAVADQVYAESTYTVSPRIYHWYRDTITDIGGVNADRSGITVTPSDDLVAILNRLAE